MTVWVKIKQTKEIGVIIGWCPDKQGRPLAMIQIRDRIFNFKIREFHCVEVLPKMVTNNFKNNIQKPLVVN